MSPVVRSGVVPLRKRGRSRSRPALCRASSGQISASLHGPAARLCPAVRPFPEAEQAVRPGALRGPVAHVQFAAVAPVPHAALTAEPRAVRGTPAAVARVARHARSAAGVPPGAARQLEEGRHARPVAAAPYAAVRALFAVRRGPAAAARHAAPGALAAICEGPGAYVRPAAAVRCASDRGSPEAVARARPASARCVPGRVPTAASLPAGRVGHEQHPELGAVLLLLPVLRVLHRALSAPELCRIPVSPMARERHRTVSAHVVHGFPLPSVGHARRVFLRWKYSRLAVRARCRMEAVLPVHARHRAPPVPTPSEPGMCRVLPRLLLSALSALPALAPRLGPAAAGGG